MTDRKTRKARLEMAGYEWAEGWFPVAFARRVRSQANAYRSEVERIVQEPPRPRGRPRKFRRGDEDG